MSWFYFAGSAVTFIKGYMTYVAFHDGRAVFWAFLCAAFTVFFINGVKEDRLLHMSFRRIDKLSGEGFEDYLTVQFKHLGYRVAKTDASHDFGADLVLKKNKEVIVVQAKRMNRNIGISAVQEAVGAVAYYGADRAMVVTNQRFTPSAKSLARQNGVELWGREELRRRFHITE